MIYLHFGVHKTATTYIQHVLALNRQRIANAGRVYWELDEIRRIGSGRIRHITRSSSGGIDALFRSVRRRLRAPLRELRELAETVDPQIISDENFLGHTDDCYGGEIYPQANRQLRFVADILGDRQQEIFLSLRNYPDFLASIYAESLRHGKFIGVNEFVGVHADPRGQWTRLVGELRELFPRAGLTIWKYEDFPRLQQVILEEMSGLKFCDLQQPADRLVRPSLSSEAVLHHNEIAENLTREERVLSIDRLESLFPPTQANTKFDPWPKGFQSRMTTAYHAEIESIVECADVRFLAP